MAKQTFQITETKAETEMFLSNTMGSLPITVVVVGCDALVDFGQEPDADTQGGIVPRGIIFKTSVIPSVSKASFKAVSGSGWITFWY